MSQRYLPRMSQSKMAQATLVSVCRNCQHCFRFARGSSYGHLRWGLRELQSNQVRHFAFRRPPEQPSLIGRFIENVRQGLGGNKEMQENIKKFQEEAKKFEKSSPFQKASKPFTFMGKAKDTVSDATEKVQSTVQSTSSFMSARISKAYEDATSSDIFKKGKEVGDELSKSAKEAVSKAQEQGEELGKTEAFKAFSSTVKTVREEVLDEELEKSRPYRTPEMLRRRTGEVENEMAKRERRIEADEDTIGMVLHKDSKWYQQWKEFKDNNAMVNGLFSLKMKYDESDNVVIRATRVVTDKLTDAFTDVFSQSDMAKTLSEITRIDPQFNKDKFLHECEFEIIPSVLEAFLRGDLELLKDWCHEPAYNVLAAQIEQTRQLGQKLDARVLDIRDVDLAMAKIMEQGPVLVLTFVAQQVMALKDSVGNVIEGGEDNIENVSYVWALCRDQTILDHRAAWRVLEFAIQHSGSWV